jgi:hypothetical protein
VSGVVLDIDCSVTLIALWHSALFLGMFGMAEVKERLRVGAIFKVLQLRIV